MNTYIGKNKFQFITDFSKHAAYDTNGQPITIDFGQLTIYERIMLSSYLTILCDSTDNNDTKCENIYNKIFNFNSVKKYVKTSYHDAFLTDLTLFLKKAPEFFHFLKNNFDKIENERTFIFRQQLNATEMDLLYSLKFQKSYKSLMNVLYIIGVAKQNIKTEFLNKILLNAFYSNSSLAKKRVEEIFNKINSVSKYKVKYRIYNNVIYFGNGFQIEEDEKFYSEDKKIVLEQLKEKEILDELEHDSIQEQPNLAPKQEVKEKIETVPTIEEPEITALNLGDETRLNKNLIVDYIENNGLEISNSASTKNTELIRKFTDSKCYKNYISKLMSGKANQDIIDTYNGCYIKGEDGLERKKNAEQQIKIIQEAVINSLNKLYDDDEDHSRYYVILNYICRNFAKLFTNF